MEHLNYIIIDDEEIDRLSLFACLKKYSHINCLGVFSSTEEAREYIGNNRVDILFLDIDMPDVNGLDFRKQMMHIPICIFITSHPEYAVDSFELETLDFIVKPVSPDRFHKTMVRVEEYMALKQKAMLYEATIADDTIHIKEGYEQIKIKLGDVLYLEGLKDYTLVVTHEKRHCVLASIGNFIKQPSFHQFTRVHRSYAVQKKFIRKMSSTEIELTNDMVLPVGRSFKQNLKKI